MAISPDIIEQYIYTKWPREPADVSLDTLPLRWKAMEPVYRAERIREIIREREESNNVH